MTQLIVYTGREAPYLNGFAVAADKIITMYPSTSGARRLTHTMLVFHADGVEVVEVVGAYDTLRPEWQAAIAAPPAGIRAPVSVTTVDGHRTSVRPDEVARLKEFLQQGSPPVDQVEIALTNGERIVVTDSFDSLVAVLS